LRETETLLQRRRERDGYKDVEDSIAPVLEIVKEHVLEFEKLIQ
jgi:hypothetical protein